MKTPQNKPELSRPLSVDKIPAAGLDEKIIASAEERKALAARFDLVDLPRLEAQLTVKPARLHHSFAVTGALSAEVVQSCVVTLDPIAAVVEQKIKLLFSPVAEGEIDPEDDEVEPIINGAIDLGETVAQFLGLGLDPYPRKPGLEFTAIEIGADSEAEKPANPFGKLVEFKKPDKP